MIWMIIILNKIVNANENNYYLASTRAKDLEMDQLEAHTDREKEALLAATLALMTCYAESGCRTCARHICENLLRLAGRSELPWQFRATLSKLRARWTLLRECAESSVTTESRSAALH